MPVVQGRHMPKCQPLLVFDGDDTLWESEPLYDQARAAAGEVVRAAGLDVSKWDNMQREMDLRNADNPALGLSSRRFPTSCLQAYTELCLIGGVSSDEETSKKVYELAASVFSARAPLMPNAAHVLERLKSDATLVLLTKGDTSVQSKRIRDSGLAELFDAIQIVEQKTEETFLEIGRHFVVSPEKSWSIGNSPFSDINPAIRAGWRAIWIDAHVWTHERQEELIRSDKVIVLDEIADLLPIFQTALKDSGNCKKEVVITRDYR